MLQVKSVVILKANPGILEGGGGIKMWMSLCVEGESYLGFGNRVRMRKTGRNIVRQKKMLTERYIWLWIRKLERRWRRLIRVVMVVSCLELPNKGLGRRKMLCGVSCLKDEIGVVKVSVDDRKKIWKLSVWKS